MKEKMKQLQSFALLLIISLLSTVTAWAQTSLSSSQFYKFYADSEKSYTELISAASLPSYITTTIQANQNGQLSSVPSITTPHDFSALDTSTKYYRLKTGSYKITITNVANLKKVRFYGNGSSSTRNISATVTKVSGTGSVFTIASIMGIPNSNATIAEYSTVDFTAQTGYDSSTYYTYQFTFSGDVSLWGIYVESGSTSPVAVTSVSLDQTSKTIGVGDSFTLTPTISPSNATDKTVSWTSSAPSKASVTSAGVVSGVAAGSATITVTTTDGSKTATCDVTVKAKHSVTYAQNGGTGTAPTQANVMETGTFTVASGSALTKTGYTFAGWNDGVNDYAVGDTYTMSTSDVTLTAQWTLNPPTFSPASSSRINPTDNITISGIANSYLYTDWAGSAKTKEQLIAGTQRTFNGSGNFTAGASGTGTRVLSAIAYDGTQYSTVATATYDIRTANTLALATTSGSVAVGSTLDISGYISNKNNTSTTVTYTSDNTSVATVTSAGVITGVAAGTTTITVAQVQTDSYTAGSATFTVTVTSAGTTYTVTYYGNGNTGGSVPTDGSSPYSAGANVTVLGNTGSLVKTGYTFAGWNTAANGSGDSYTAGNTISSISGDITLYAQWEAAAGSSNTYYYGCMTLTAGALTPGSTSSSPLFVKAGATLASSTDISLSSTPGATSCYYNSDNLSSSSLATSSNWSTSSSSSRCIRGVKFDANTTYTLALGSITATSITFYGWCASSSKILTIGGVGYTTPSTKNQFFTHTYTKAGNFTGNITITQDSGSGTYGILVIETAAGSATYNVTYNGNGNTSGTVPTDATNYANNASVTIKANGAGGVTALARTGYAFSGWNNKADGTGADFTPSNTFTITRDTTLYAKWTPDEYTVTLNGNGGTGGSASVTATYGAALPSFTAPIHSGYVLKGFYTASSAGDQVIDEDGNLVASVDGYTDSNSKWIKDDDATLYAQWDAVYTVTFDATTNSGTCATASLTQESVGANIILPAATKENCTFNGWYTAPTDGTCRGGTGDSYGSSLAANETLYAQFSDPVVSTTKFHFLSKTSTDNINGTINVTESNYADDLDGGTLEYKSDGSRDYKYGLKLGSNAAYLKITLTSALANGDVITFDQGTGDYQISFTNNVATRSTTPATSGETYTVTAGDGLNGATILYVWRASGSTTYVKELTIATAGAVTSTYSVAFDTQSIADDIETLEEQTTLPNPLPTPTNVTDGYTFEGWYTNAELTTEATAGAAINANTTLYANYIIDTPTITPASGAVYGGITMTLTSSVPFTQAYGGWTAGSVAYTKEELLTHSMYNNSEAPIDTYNGFTMSTTTGTQRFTYIVSDGKFWSRPAITEAYTVSNIITITTQPKSATYIEDDTATALTVVAADSKASAALSYQWKQSATEDGTYTNVSAGTGGTTASYTPVTTSTGTTYYKCVISSDSGADAVETDAVYVTVNAAASYTVSFDKGVGSNTAVGDLSGTSITLPSVTLKDDGNYQFDGWYLESTKIGVAGDTWTPTGSVTLTAKYNCKVVLERGAGEGNVPTAVRKDTGATVTSGSFVPEGTTITLTASPAGDFVNWSVGMTGTDNPKDYVVNDYKRFVANYVVPEYKKLFHTTFTESGWSAIAGVNGGGTATDVGDDTYAPHDVTMKCGSGISYGWTSGTLTMAAKNYDSENYIAIPVTGVNGELTITVANGSNKTQFKYNVVLGSSTDNPGSSTSSTANKPSTVTVKGLTASNYVVYIGRQSGSYAKYTEITITTPNTKLAADSAQVRIMKDADTDTPTATVQITTNSSGAVSIKTAPNGSVATAAYSEGTLTITPKGAGTTSVVMQVAASGDYTARELTIPITVQVPTITINTQPSNIVCYQNDAADKTFTVVATVNTGNELTYQWYTCNSDGSSESTIPGAINDTYTLNTSQKATVGTTYYKCKVTSATDGLNVYTAVRSVTVSALSAGGTYNTTVYAVAPGHTVTYTGLASNSISSDTGTEEVYTTNTATANQLVITAVAKGTGVITLDDGTVINVTVKNHTVQLIWSAEKVEKDVTDWATNGTKLMLGTDSNPEVLPTLTRLYEDGTAYTGTVTYYIDDTSMAFFNTSGTGSYTQTSGVRPNIYYAGGQGGCKFYAYIGSGTGIDPVKASYDLRLKKGYSNDLPSGRKVEVQQQYTLWKNATDKLITVTYGGYKYNDHKWDGKADSWGTATNYVGKDNAIDGYLYAVRNKDRDAKDEYKHAVQEEDDFGSAWYSTSETKPDGSNYAAYERIKPFRLPCRASYVTFTAHASGTLTAYVYQNGIIGRGTGAGNQLASAPRLGYWFDEEGWVQEPANTVVTKQVIQKGNARDQRSYGGYADMDAQLDGYWKDAADAIIKTKLRYKWCSVANPNKNTLESAFSNAAEKPDGYYDNPYYWGTHTEVEDNLAEVVPTPERPIPHQGGHMIVNEGYVKYTINVKAGHTYYFFGKMTKVGYAGMNFVEAASENRQTSRVDLATDDNWSEKFDTHASSVLVGDETTIYDKITVPSNYRIGKWNTICLPFAVDENQVEKVFGKGTQLAIFNGLREDSENKVYYIKYLRHVDQNILPGQPYLILPTGSAVVERSNQENGGMAETGETIATVDAGGGDLVIGSTSTGGSGTRIVFNNVIINKGITAQSYGCDVDADGETTSYIFTGTDEQKDIEKYDLYIAPKKGALMRYMPADPATTMTLNSYHAFIKANAPKIKQDAITFAFTEDDLEKSWEQTFIEEDDPGEPTNIVFIEDDGIEDVGNAIVVRHSGKTYNMMGQQVDPRSAKGMVIVNGKKYIK